MLSFTEKVLGMEEALKESTSTQNPPIQNEFQTLVVLSMAQEF